MTDTEKRRMELLAQTRNLYQGGSTIPAIHPRYKSTYEELYCDTKEKGTISSFNIRLILAVLLFVIFAGMNYTETAILDYQTNEITEVISYNFIVEEEAVEEDMDENEEMQNVDIENSAETW